MANDPRSSPTTARHAHRMFSAPHGPGNATCDRARPQLAASPDAAKVAQACDVDGLQFRNRRINRLESASSTPARWRGPAGCLPTGSPRVARPRARVRAVREQPIDHAGDVPHMKRRGRHTGWPAVPFILRQPINHFTDAFAHLEKDVGHRLKNGGNVLRWDHAATTQCIAISSHYQNFVGPLIDPDSMAFRTSSIDARPRGAMPPHSNRVAAGVQ